MPWTYIVECADGSYYVGSTWDLERRMWEHNHDPAGAAYTRRRRPVTLVWAAPYDSISEAFRYEKQIQGWNRSKREALIRGDLESLPGLSGRRARSTDRWSHPQSGGFETGAERLPQPPDDGPAERLPQPPDDGPAERLPQPPDDDPAERHPQPPDDDPAERLPQPPDHAG